MNDRKACTFEEQYHDWSVHIAKNATDQFSVIRNASLTAVAYAAQTAAIFGFLFVATTFIFALSTLRRYAFSDGGPFYFEPLERDERLGLGLLGDAYNAYLTLVIMFYSYAAVHRAQLHMREVKQSVAEFLGAAAKVDLSAISTSLSSGLEAGMYMLVLIGMPLAVFAIVFFPLLTLRRYINSKRVQIKRRFQEELKKEQCLEAKLARELATAVEPAKHEELKAQHEAVRGSIAKLDGQLERIRRTQVWPNGSARAYASMFICALLVISAISSLLLVYLIGLIGITVPAIFLWIGRRTGVDLPIKS